MVKVVAAVAGPVLLVRLGLPALGALLLIVIITVGMLCWIISSHDRSGNAAQLIAAIRGQKGGRDG